MTGTFVKPCKQDNFHYCTPGEKSSDGFHDCQSIALNITKTSGIVIPFRVSLSLTGIRHDSVRSSNVVKTLRIVLQYRAESQWFEVRLKLVYSY